MPRRTIDQLEPGMVLAEAATGPRGNVLLGDGVELTERHIRALKTWGVSAVQVEGEEDAAETSVEELAPELLEAARAEVEPRFALAGHDAEPLAQLFNWAVRQRALQLKRRGT